MKNLIERAHATAKEKGFWEEKNRNVSEILMLIVSELAEAQEALRKNLNADKQLYGYTAVTVPGAASVCAQQTYPKGSAAQPGPGFHLA